MGRNGGPWAADRPYIIETQRCNERPCLVYPTRSTVTNNMAPSTGLAPNGSFWPNAYLVVMAISMQESAFAGPHEMFRLMWTRYVLL
jgi:hypothetical protein